MGEVNSPCAEVLPAANRSYGANAPPARRPVGRRCGPVLNIDFSRPFHVGAKSALLRRSFIPTGEKNVIRPLPCSSSPNRTKCVGLRFVAALWATFFVSDKNIAFNRSFLLGFPRSVASLSTFSTPQYAQIYLPNQKNPAAQPVLAMPLDSLLPDFLIHQFVQFLDVSGLIGNSVVGLFGI